MAKIKFNPLVVGVSGTMGNVVFRKSKYREAILSQRPTKSKAEPSEAQQAQRERFKQANQYARAALADPATRAHYEEIAAQEGESAFAVARNDYFQGKDLLSQK